MSLSAAFALCRSLAPSLVAIFASTLRQCPPSLGLCYQNPFLFSTKPISVYLVYNFLRYSSYLVLPHRSVFLSCSRSGFLFPSPITHLFRHFSSSPYRGNSRALLRSFSIFLSRPGDLPSSAPPLASHHIATTISVLVLFPDLPLGLALNIHGSGRRRDMESNRYGSRIKSGWMGKHQDDEPFADVVTPDSFLNPVPSC